MAFSEMAWLAGVMLLSIRLGVLAVAAPPLGSGSLPGIVRLGIVLTLSAMLVSTIEPPTAKSLQLPWLVAAAISEIAFGSMLALGLNIAFSMFTLGARLLDVQIGFGIGQVLDPITRQPVPVLGAVFSQLALLSFFALDGHHALMRGLTLSVQHVPPGAGWLVDQSLMAVTVHISKLFSLGFAMVAPVVCCLLMVELGLAVIARNLPQVNALALGLPIKVMAGLFALTLWATGAGDAVARAHASVFSAWEAMWR